MHIVAARLLRPIESLNEIKSFAGALFHERDHVVILDKPAPSGC